MRNTLLSALALSALIAAFPASASENPLQSTFCPKKGLPSIVGFEARWCTPCKLMQPAWRVLEKDYKDSIAFVHIDVDDQAELSRALRISAVPTQIIFGRDCKVLDAHAGYISEDELRSAFKILLERQQ